MRFFRFVFFALFWMAIGLGVGVLPLNGSTVWERLSSALNLSGKAGGGKAGSGGKAAGSPLGSYTAKERAALDKLIRGGGGESGKPPISTP